MGATSGPIRNPRMGWRIPSSLFHRNELSRGRLDRDDSHVPGRVERESEAMLGGIAGEDHETEAIDVAGGREIRLVQLQRLLAGMLLRAANDGDDLRVVLGIVLRHLLEGAGPG